MGTEKRAKGDAAKMPSPVADSGRAGSRRAAGIYGAIITAAIMTAAGASLPTSALAVTVLVTLIVYWLAEQYAELLGEPERNGKWPRWSHTRTALADSWPMVSASFVPIIALVVSRGAGASASSAATIGVVTAIALLTFHGWSAGRAAHFHGWQLAATTAIAAGLGLVMVVLKNLVIHHLHLAATSDWQDATMPPRHRGAWSRPARL